MKIINIVYDIGRNEIKDYINYEDDNHISGLLGMSIEAYCELTDEQRYEYIVDALENNKISIYEMFNLPSEMELPDSEYWEGDSITEYITNETDFLIQSWEYGE